MSRRKKQLEERIQELDGGERQRLYKRAARMRKASVELASGHGKRRRRSTRDWLDSHDDGPAVQKMTCSSSDPLDHWVERLIDQEDRDVPGSEPAPMFGERTEGVVVGIGPGRCRVWIDADREHDCRLNLELAETQRTDLAVGDRVGVAFPAADDAVVDVVFPRRTTLSRPDPGKKRPVERVIAANIDAVVIVAAVKTPPLRPRLIDRYLIAVERGGATPIIVVNKVDLLSSEAELEEQLASLAPYRQLGIDILACSASSGRGISTVLDALHGRTCVLVGHSGVGKSSLLNALQPELDLDTAAVNSGTGKGRHTTTAFSLYFLDDETRVIDTPGIRQLGLWKLGREQLRWYFPEFDPWAPDCRFSDCSHLHEPSCAVKAAVRTGEISALRYDTYERLSSPDYS